MRLILLLQARDGHFSNEPICYSWQHNIERKEGKCTYKDFSLIITPEYILAVDKKRGKEKRNGMRAGEIHIDRSVKVKVSEGQWIIGGHEKLR